MSKNYLFQSERLGFRPWESADLLPMAAINADKEVMEFFPGTINEEQTLHFMNRMNDQLSEKGLCYFAVDILEKESFIGFIGISEQHFESDFTPCIDIGWRLSKKAWRKGYATEGAKRCLKYAFNDLQLDKVYALAPLINVKSVHVMEKVGMTQVRTFIHPKLTNNERLKECVLYSINRNSFEL